MTDIGINCNTNNSVYNKKRIVTDRNICEIISELEKTEWGEILNSDDVNVSYETFVNKLTDIYRKKCPIVTSMVTNKRHYKPWMTSGLKNACKKKNLLYKMFLKSRSKQRATTTSAFLHRNIRTCPRKTKHLAYTTLVRPILEYASIIWDPHTGANIHTLEMVQRRSARHIMHNYTRHASVTTMLQHLDLPILQQRRQHSKIIMLYRIRHQLASIPTATYIIPSTRNTQHYILPYARTLVFQTSFFPSTIKIWNNLQPVITNSTTIPRLRKALQSTPTSGRRGATLSA